ncbi:MAG: hypothetical protein J5750_01525 [Clostridiales bacterium]|nr:hypothetical protein [Clostridiales bacterium]
MLELSSIGDTAMWYAICALSCFLIAGAFAVLLRTLYDARGKKQLGIAWLNMVLTFVEFTILMDCAFYIRPGRWRPYFVFQEVLFSLPYILYAGVEILSCVLLLICIRDGMLYREKSLTQDAVRQAIDILPEGIAICDRDGTVRLSNLRINRLCKALTGERFIDASRLWSFIEETGSGKNGQYIVLTRSKEAWLFEKTSLPVAGREYEQITATEVTERYGIIEILKEKNERLLDIQRRMKAVSELSGDMFVAQEEADARAALHNQLGQVLLMGRHYLLHRDVTDPKVVYAATRQMNQFLLGESEEPYQGEEDAVASAVSMANSIGVHVQINGTIPTDPVSRALLSQAITECAANTVKHAEGDTITIKITEEAAHAASGDATEETAEEASQPAREKGTSVRIEIRNNGKPPKGTIAESGGLLTLHRRVAEAGGAMKVESDPEFLLTVLL